MNMLSGEIADERLNDELVFPVLGTNLEGKDYCTIDLSETHDQTGDEGIDTYQGLEGYVRRRLELKKAKVAYGGYREKRNIYARSGHFHSETENRNIHLGVDLWAPEGTPVFAPLSGVVHSSRYNDQYLDYGATIILAHEFRGISFFALYGHLSVASLEGCQKGEVIEQSQPFASLGAKNENGGWVPHLHLQMILDMEGWEGDYPGVCSENEKRKYFKSCPNPIWLCFV